MGTEKYLEKMQEDMELRGLAESSRIRYVKSVEQFLSRCSKPVEELDEEDVRKYSLELMEAGVKASTFNIHQAGMGNCLRKKEQNILPLCRCHLES